MVGRASNTAGYSSNLVVGSRNSVSAYAFSLAYGHPANNVEVFHGFMVTPGAMTAPSAVSDTTVSQTRVFNPMRQGLIRHSAAIQGSSLHVILPVANVPTPVRFDVASSTHLLDPGALSETFNSTESPPIDHLELNPLEVGGTPAALQVFASARDASTGAHKIAFRDYAYVARAPRYYPLAFNSVSNQGGPVRTAAIFANSNAYGVVTVAEQPPRMIVAERIPGGNMQNTHPAAVRAVNVSGAFVADTSPLKSDEPIDSPARPLAVTFLSPQLLVAVPRQVGPGNAVVVYSVDPGTGVSAEVAVVPMGAGNQKDVRLSFQNFSGNSTLLVVSYRTSMSPGQDGVVRLLRIAKAGGGGLAASHPLDQGAIAGTVESSVVAVGPFGFGAQSGVAFCSVLTALDQVGNPGTQDSFTCHSLVEAP